MTRCIIKDQVWMLYNSVSFVEIDKDNNIKFGYLMFNNDISYKSKEYILDFYSCINRSDALSFALAYNSKCASFENFSQVEDYIHDIADFLRSMQALRA